MQCIYKIGSRIASRLMIPMMLILFASMSATAMASDEVYQLLVKMKNDEDKSFVLLEKPVVSFTATECVIDYKGFTSYFDMSEIKDVTIVNKDTSIKETVMDMVTLDYTNPATVVVRGLPAGVTVTLHTVDGIMLDTVQADSDGNATINMKNVQPGTICIISVNSIKNFKIYKK